jgi:hypothetical protein
MKNDIWKIASAPPRVLLFLLTLSSRGISLLSLIEGTGRGSKARVTKHVRSCGQHGFMQARLPGLRCFRHKC